MILTGSPLPRSLVFKKILKKFSLAPPWLIYPILSYPWFGIGLNIPGSSGRLNPVRWLVTASQIQRGAVYWRGAYQSHPIFHGANCLSYNLQEQVFTKKWSLQEPFLHRSVFLTIQVNLVSLCCIDIDKINWIRCPPRTETEGIVLCTWHNKQHCNLRSVIQFNDSSLGGCYLI